MISLNTILLICALVCFLLATFNVPAKISLVALGLALWVLTVILTGHAVAL